MYPDPRVARFVEEHFVPIRVHVREQADAFKRLGEKYDAQWTPTLLVLDAGGTEHHRVEGFLPVDDMLPQLMLGLAQVAFAQKNFTEAEQQFRAIVGAHGDTDAAAEAQYWAGVSRYKATGDGAALADTARQFEQRYRDTPWAKKASVWAK